MSRRCDWHYGSLLCWKLQSIHYFMSLISTIPSMLYIIPSTIIALALLFLTPLKTQLPFVVQCTLVGGLLLLVGLYGIMLFKERVRDEREASIRSLAHRISYLAGIGGLVLIMGYRLLTTGHIYPETVLLLVFLVSVKAAVHWYGERYL